MGVKYLYCCHLGLLFEQYISLYQMIELEQSV